LSRSATLLRRTPLGRARFMTRLQDIIVLLLNRNNIVDSGEFRIKVHSPTDFLAKKLITYGIYEKHLVDLMRSLVRPGDTVLDVGANIGCHTLYLSRAVGPTGKVLAFEPDVENLTLLQENLRTNRCDNVIVFPFALGSENGIRQLFVDDTNRGAQGFANSREATRSITVEVRRAADLIPEFRPSLAKIDVEGAEPLVIGGMNHKPRHLVFEFIPSLITAVGNDPLQFLSDLVAEGYTIFRIEGTKLVPLNPRNLLDFVKRDDIDYNLFARRT